MNLTKILQHLTQTLLIPIKNGATIMKCPSIGGLRYLTFFAKDNGFDAVVCRIGRRVLIDEAAFFEWASNSPPNHQHH